jgi:predicted nucleotidyltransferase
MKQHPSDPVIDRFGRLVREGLGAAVVAIYWFGSRSRGDCGETSDYDLLLETKDPLTEQQRDLVSDVAVDIASDAGVLLDIHYRTSASLSTPPSSFSPFIQSVRSEGVLV